MSQQNKHAKINEYRIIYKKQKNIIASALKSVPSPPDYISSDICCEQCHVCHKQWFENTITIFRCQCKAIRLCPMCADKNIEPDYMEHNMVDCDVDEEWGGENVNWDE